jgi:hypothetical protein
MLALKLAPRFLLTGCGQAHPDRRKVEGFAGRKRRCSTLAEAKRHDPRFRSGSVAARPLSQPPSLIPPPINTAAGVKAFCNESVAPCFRPRTYPIGGDCEASATVAVLRLLTLSRHGGSRSVGLHDDGQSISRSSGGIGQPQRNDFRRGNGFSGRSRAAASTPES